MLKLATKIAVASIIVAGYFAAASAAYSPEAVSRLQDDIRSVALFPYDIDTVANVICSVGAIQNRISNSTIERATLVNDWTVLIGDDALEMGSMRWSVPADYAPINDYLYLGSLRIGSGGRMVHLSTDTSPGVDARVPPQSVSDFDTHFYISDQSDAVPPYLKLNVAVHQHTYAWSRMDGDDFIIYDYWIVNLNDVSLNGLYVALHADCDVSVAEGGSGAQAFSRDDQAGYYRDYETGEFISYMYDDDNPNVPGDDRGGNKTPRESRGYIGSRLLYCPPVAGDTAHSRQKGHGWWDWNSDPGTDAEWFALISDSAWYDPPPSPHDFRFLQKLGPFDIAGRDSIRVVFAFGIGNGLIGMRANLNNAHLLFENQYVYHNLPPGPPDEITVSVADQNLEFDWQAGEDDDIEGYNLYFSTDPAGPFQLANGSLIYDTNYIYSPAGRGLFYFYLTSVDSGGAESIPSDVLRASTLPSPPSNLRAIPGDNLIRLKWITVEGATAYRIYRSLTAGGPYAQIAEVSHPESTFTDNNVTNLQRYYYVATTLKWGYESFYSGEVGAVPAPGQNGRVLLVDDYFERESWGARKTYPDLLRFYERWGVHNFDYDVWMIPDSGMVDSATIMNYQAVVFASDADRGVVDSIYTWWIDVGAVGGGVLTPYLRNGGHLLAAGSQVLWEVFNYNPPRPGDFEYDWFGIDSIPVVGGEAWSNSDDFTWAVAARPGYPDSMKIDVGENQDQVDFASCIYALRLGAEALFTKGRDIGGAPPLCYDQPIATIYSLEGMPKTCLIGFDLHIMPSGDVLATVAKVLRDEFGCTYYSDPAPLPPWRLALSPGIGLQFRLAWDPIDEDDVVNIKIYRSVNGLPFQTLTALSPGRCEYYDNDIVPGSVYSYRLSCVDFIGQEGPFSRALTDVGGRPQPITGLQADSQDGLVGLTWSAPADPIVDTVNVYRRLSYSGEFGRIASLPNSVNYYQDTDVINGNSYFYYATAVSVYDIESAPSDTVYAFPQGQGERSGILIVNGLDWGTYGDEIYQLYAQRALVGSFDYHFWDLFVVPSNTRPFPETVIGEGPFDPSVLNTHQVVIWAGNNFNGDLEQWLAQGENLIDYLNNGGSLILLSRMGQEFMFQDLMDYCHITGFQTGINPDSLVAEYDGLINLVRAGSQSLTDLVALEPSAATVLFRAVGFPDWAAGFWVDRPSDGDFIFVAGRPYRWDLSELRINSVIMLRDFLGITDVQEKEAQVPRDFILCQNYPNPFNPATLIRFGLPAKSQVRLTVFDILGRKVRALADQEMPPGYHEIMWDGRNATNEMVSSGVYFYRLDAGEYKSVKKMLIVK